MRSTAVAMEEGKEKEPLPTRANKSGALPVRLLMVSLFFLLLGLGFCIASMFAVKYFGVQNQIIVALMVLSNVRPCFDEPSSVAAWVKPLSYSLHNMNDSKMFWQASFVPRIKAYPFKRVRKIAFMFLTKGPLLLSPLWERFFKGHGHLFRLSTIFCFSPETFRARLQSGGTMSMCDAERRLLASALLDISNEWFILLSESCIPLRSFSVTYLYLSRCRYRFMCSFDEPGSYGRGRYNWNMAPDVNLTEWRKGSQWFEVNRKLALDTVADTLYYPKFKEFCQPACYVDEHYFHTMLSVKSPHLLANRSLTYVDWSRGEAHPATFGRGDITENFFRKISKGSTCIYNDQPSHFVPCLRESFLPVLWNPF